MSEVIVTNDGIKIRFIKSGIGTMIGSSIDLFGTEIDSFAVGDLAGFEPRETEETPRGEITYRGSRNTIKIKFDKEEATLKISMVIPENVNDLKIGNIMVYANSSTEVVPIILMTLPRQIVKQNVSNDLTNLGFLYPGTRMVISVSVKYVDANEAGVSASITAAVPTYTNIPFFGSDSDLPVGDANPWQQFILNSFGAMGGSPTFVTKEENNQYYATPLFQDIKHPKYGVIVGGQSMERVNWIFGGLYSNGSELYTGNIGGMSYDNSSEQATVVGGQSY